MSGLAHFAHFVMSILTGFLWVPIWIVCALCCGSSKRNKMQKLQETNNELLAKLVEQQKQQNMYKNYRD